MSFEIPWVHSVHLEVMKTITRKLNFRFSKLKTHSFSQTFLRPYLPTCFSISRSIENGLVIYRNTDFESSLVPFRIYFPFVYAFCRSILMMSTAQTYYVTTETFSMGSVGRLPFDVTSKWMAASHRSCGVSASSSRLPVLRKQHTKSKRDNHIGYERDFRFDFSFISFFFVLCCCVTASAIIKTYEPAACGWIVNTKRFLYQKKKRKKSKPKWVRAVLHQNWN